MFTITASALSLNVADPVASAEFAKRHLGFEEVMAADGFVSLSRTDAGFNLVFLRTGLESFKPESMRGHGSRGIAAYSASTIRSSSSALPGT